MKAWMVFLSFGFSVLACSQPSAEVDCKPYFDYDQIVHYTYQGSAEYSHELYTLREGTREDQIIFGWLVGDATKILTDTVDLNLLQSHSFQVSEIPVSQFDTLNTIFCQREHFNQMYAGCEPIYRDILLFRKEGKTMGFARLCFQCEMASFTGTDRNTMDFGQSGDFHRLRLLLK